MSILARLSPYLRDRNERAAKTILYAFGSFLFEEWIGTLVALGMTERALVMAAGAGFVSVGGSWVSRYVGESGTCSMTRTYAYGDKVPAPPAGHRK